MVELMVEKIMKGAIERLSQREEKEPSTVGLIIHSKDDEYTPLYAYKVERKIKKDEVGNTVHLKFNRDILGLKFDWQMRESIAASFFTTYFKTLSRDLKIEHRQLYLHVEAKDDEIKELELAIYHRADKLKEVTLAQVLGT